MNKGAIVFSLVCAVPFVSSAASADVLASNPFDAANAPNLGLPSENQDGGFYNQRLAEDFNLGAGSTIQVVHFWGSEEGYFSLGYPGNISAYVIEFYADAGGNPGALLDSQTLGVGSVTATDTGLDLFSGSDIFQFSADIADLNLGAGNYHVGVSALFINSTQSDDSFFLAPGLNAGASVASPPSGSYLFDPNATGFAFELEGVVPAPGALALLGLAGVAARRRRRA